MRRYKFPPMLGPASGHPKGSRERAECLGNELEYKVERAEYVGVDDLVPLVQQIIDEEPWTVWPEPPCHSVDRFVELCTGLTYQQLQSLIVTFKPKLAAELDTARAKEQAQSLLDNRKAGKYLHHDMMKVVKRQGGSKAYLLRRIAREAPEVLERYEKGEFKNVRAAADAAGIPRLSRVVRLRSEWKHASSEEREEFLEYLKQQQPD